MKSASELASSFLTSPKEHKRLALALRRHAGGVKAAAERKDSSGLTAKEVRTLLDAVAILGTLADNHIKAEKMKQAEYDARDAAERTIRTAMSKNFMRLTGIPDQVALIAAVSSSLLRNAQVKTLADLKYHFDDCINSLSYRLATEASKNSPESIVADAWDKFEGAKADLLDKHAALISRLLMASEQ